MNEIDLSSPDLYLNRELSLLQFNQRVLELALDDTIPLLERLSFLFICNRNIDEFFEVRVAGVKQQHLLGSRAPGHDGRTPLETLSVISEKAHELASEQGRIFESVLLPQLAQQDIHLLQEEHWSEALHAWLKRYFRSDILPLLTPIGLDLAHPFPRLVNKSSNFIVSLEGKDAFGRDSGLAVLQMPRVLPRLVKPPASLELKGDAFVFLSSIIQAFARELFPGMTVTGSYAFRLTRNSDLLVDEDEADDLLKALKGKLFSRRYGDVVRLEVASECPQWIQDFLLQKFNLDTDDLYQLSGPLNLSRLSSLILELDKQNLFYPPFSPGLPRMNGGSKDLFEVLQNKDILLHHPYESFRPVEELLNQAAYDPNVLAIKMTLYRTETKSKLVDSLVEAARAGKEVTAVIELRARFDEEGNIELANRLQEAGALVVYGVVGYKTHAKMMLIVRREKNRIRRYVHLGTGNYHSFNAQRYVDFSLLTSEKEITTDVHYVFQQLTGMGRATKLKKIIHAPFTLHTFLLKQIQNEIEQVKAGNDGHLIFKMNALTEPALIEALYKASQAGVTIELIIRGVCCLTPGIANISTNIKVRSVMGRFLEHARVYFFNNGGECKTYLSSADGMERNLFSRVEVCFPVEDKKLAARVRKEALQWQMSDNYLSWELSKDGSYKRNSPHSKQSIKSAQEQCLKLLSSVST